MIIRDLTVRPIDVWPDGWRDVGRGTRRKPNPFQTKSYQATVDVLGFELEKLDARDAHLQLDIAAGDVRRDGMPRAGAKVGHPGVILTVDSRAHGVLTYPCDTFSGRWSNDPPDWQINLRAIALGLEALRKVERYGIAERGQQYAGFGALPPATATGPAMSVDEAARLLVMSAGRLRGNSTTEDIAEHAHELWREAAKAHHPDAGGDPAMFRRITEARDLLTGASS